MLSNSVKIITAGLMLSMLTACASTKPKQNEVIESYGNERMYASIGMPYGNSLSICAIGNTKDLGELILNDVTPAWGRGYSVSNKKGVLDLIKPLDRKTIFATYDNYASSVNEYKIYIDQLSNKYTNGLSRVNKVISIDDKSGLYQKDVDFNGLVTIDKNNITSKINGKFIFDGPCPGGHSYIKDAVITSGPINTTRIINDFSKLNNAMAAEREDLTRLAGYYKISTSNNNRYNYTLNVTDTVPFSNNEMAVPVKVTITSRNYDKPLFPSHTFSDKNISIELKSGYIKIRNNTDQYIKLLSITTYLNDIVSNYSLKDDQAIELPPHSSSNDIKYDSLVTNSILDASQIRNMTLNISKSTQVSFGIAAKYRIGEQNIDKTLYTKQKNYSVYDILKANQLL